MEITVSENDVFAEIVDGESGMDVPESESEVVEDGEELENLEEGGGGDPSVSDNSTSGDGGGSGGNAEPVTPAPAGGDGQGSPESRTEEKLDSVLESLDLMKQQDNDNPVLADFTDTLKDLIVVLSPNPSEPETPVMVFPALPDGYQDYRYPIDVQIEVRPKGSDYSMGMGLACTMPNQFADEIADLTSQVESGVYDMARVQYVYETGNDGKTNVLVYDYEHVVSPDEPETPDEPTETEKTVLELLESVTVEVQSIRENDIVYRDEMLLLQQEIKVLQTQSLASSIALGMCIFLGVGYMVANGFWSRMKVG